MEKLHEVTLMIDMSNEQNTFLSFLFAKIISSVL